MYPRVCITELPFHTAIPSSSRRVSISKQTAFPVLQLLQHYLKVSYSAGDIAVTSLRNDGAISTAYGNGWARINNPDAERETQCEMTHVKFQNAIP